MPVPLCMLKEISDNWREVMDGTPKEAIDKKIQDTKNDLFELNEAIEECRAQVNEKQQEVRQRTLLSYVLIGKVQAYRELLPMFEEVENAEKTDTGK